MDHALLVEDLKAIGTDPQAVEWFAPYLNSRYHVTSVEGCQSHPREVLVIIPQGSILGPLLFFIYVNDLVCKRHSDIL